MNKMVKTALVVGAGYLLYKTFFKPKPKPVMIAPPAPVSPAPVSPAPGVAPMAGMSCTGCLGATEEFVAAEFEDQFGGGGF